MSNIPEELMQQLDFLDEEMLLIEEKNKQYLKDIHPGNFDSAVNFLKYLLFRSKDQRKAQEMLHDPWTFVYDIF